MAHQCTDHPVDGRRPVWAGKAWIGSDCQQILAEDIKRIQEALVLVGEYLQEGIA